MRRGVIRIGDPLSSGGQVVSACSHFKVDGKEVAGVGDACHCNRHGDVKIVEGIETFTFFGKKLALHGCKASCGCSVISTTELMVVDTGGGATAQEGQREPPRAAEAETKQAPTLAEKEAQTGQEAQASQQGVGGFLGLALSTAAMGAIQDGDAGAKTALELYARPTSANETEAGKMAHAFLLIQASDGKWFEVTGGKDPKTDLVAGYVNPAKSKDDAIKNALDKAPLSSLRLLGSTKVDAKYGTIGVLSGLAKQFNSTVGKRGYDWQGPNSNTYANWFLRQMGINMPARTQTEYYNLHGWNWNL